jgi:hypothetical protein
LKVAGSDTLPALSIAEQLTAKVPSPNVEPEAGAQLTEATWLVASVKVGSEKETIVPPGPVASSTTLVGVPESAGFVASLLIVID